MTSTLPNSVFRIVSALGLQPLPMEGGFYKEIFRSPNTIEFSGSPHATSTNIYYLITSTQFSRWHKLLQDETWSYLGGTSTAAMDLINPDGEHSKVLFGDISKVTLNNSQVNTLSFTVPANSWFTVQCESDNEESYALFSCVCAPGFEFSDVEYSDSLALTKVFPRCSGILKTL